MLRSRIFMNGIMHYSFRDIDQKLGTLEHYLNICSWTPILHFASGPFRLIVAKMEIAVGALFAAYSYFKGILTCNTRLFSNAKRGLEYVLHGYCNLVRAGVEVLPLSFALTCLYDAGVGRMNYRFERLPRGVYPLLHTPV